MAHKIVGFAYSASDNSSYINIQLQAIKKEFPALDIELADENDSRLERLPVNLRSRLPVYIVYKNNVYKTHKTGKYEDHQVVSWLNSLNSINA